MLPKNKNHSMLLSYRNFSRNLENELKLSVRRGLAAVTAAAAVDNNESDTKKIDETVISGQMENISIDEMTSSDISKDYRAHFREHKHLLKDTIYTKKWWKAICCNRHLFKDKIVLDVTCGLGMLSMFSAIAGAKHVYAIDTSNSIQLTHRIVADNKLTHKITMIKGKASDIILPIEHVDIIVSSFLGETLLVGNHFDELIDARKKWLSPNGLMFPDRCGLYITAIDNEMLCDRSNYWQHVYAFDMRPMIPAVLLEPYPQRVNWKQVVSDPCLIKHMNMYTMEKHDYRRFDTPFRLECNFKTCIGAFVTYFDIEFNEGLNPIRFTTVPGLPSTQWRPLIFFLARNDFNLNKGDRFYGVFRFNALDDDFRKIDWNIEVMHRGEYSYFRDNWTFQTR